MHSYLHTLETFSIDTLPTLDVCVAAALERFLRDSVPTMPRFASSRVLIIGSVNAAAVGRIVGTTFKDAVCADESDYIRILSSHPPFDSALLISASGGKHAVSIAKHLQEIGLHTVLITHNPTPLAGDYVKKENVYVFPKNREPYTYNTSTYLGVILATTHESSSDIWSFIDSEVRSKLTRDFSFFDAFYITIPTHLRFIAPMILTKFDELFGSRISCRVYTVEQAKHATTVVPSPKEFFISFGDPGQFLAPPERHLTIDLPENAGYGLLMAASYFIVGTIQQQNPPYFKENINEYCERASKLFNQKIEPIVS